MLRGYCRAVASSEEWGTGCQNNILQSIYISIEKKTKTGAQYKQLDPPCTISCYSTVPAEKHGISDRSLECKLIILKLLADILQHYSTLEQCYNQ